MRLHLDALILLHRVWAGFGALAAASLLIVAGGAGAALVEQGVSTPPSRGAIWILTICAAGFAAGAAGALWSARGLRRREQSGRVLALFLAAPNMILVPFGTALAVYTLWVLLNDDARSEFGRPPRNPLTATR